MPPTPSPAPAEPAQPARRLRNIPAGYDLGPLPIRVPPRHGEAVVSWLRRASLRYDVPARILLRVAGTRQPISSTTRAATRLRNNPVLLQRLGLTADDRKQLLTINPIGAATDDYLKTLQRTTLTPAGWFRYCPLCLADPDPGWAADWQQPLTLLCLRHRVYLHTTCPGCGQHPMASPVWMSRPSELWACPARLPRHPNGAGRVVRPWCNTDLREIPACPVDADVHAAQQLLLTWAGNPQTLVTACKVTVTHAIGFHAFADLVDAYYQGDAHHLLDLTRPPQATAGGFRVAARVLTAASLDDAAAAASPLLRVAGSHAPIHPVTRLAGHPHNPLLAALQIHDHRDQLSPTYQLTFRTSHPLGRYPINPDLGAVNRLRLPEHRSIGKRPERDPAWFPQTLWPDALPNNLAADMSSPLHRACLAIALAKLGTAANWAEITQILDLPHRTDQQHRIRIGQLDPQRDLAGHPLPHRPAAANPPNPTTPRRLRAAPHTRRDIDVLDLALARTAHTHPSPLTTDQLRRVFWEAFTGGDITYAPQPLTISAGGREYLAYRTDARDSFDRDLPRLQTAHHEISRLTDENLGPLTWTPRKPHTVPTGTTASRSISTLPFGRNGPDTAPSDM
jgi:hypothetical protein